MGVSQNVSGLKRNGRALAIATKVLTCRSLRRGARYGVRQNIGGLRSDHPALAIAAELLTHRPPHPEARHSEA